MMLLEIAWLAFASKGGAKLLQSQKNSAQSERLWKCERAVKWHN